MSRSILVIQSSHGDAHHSVTRQLTAEIVQRLLLEQDKKQDGETKTPQTTASAAAVVHVRDLAVSPLPHIDAAFLRGAQDAASDEAIREVVDADVVVIALPMHNFGIPSCVKAWIDHIVRAGRTFRYNTATGLPEGLLGADKQRTVYLALASGGVYSTGPMSSYDYVEPYMRKVLGFIGLHTVHVVRAEGVAMPGLKETALAKALDSMPVA